MQAEVKALYRSVRRFNATCSIVFSAVLPHGCDLQHPKELHSAFNRFLWSFARDKHWGYMPTYTSFFFTKRGQERGALLKACLW